VSNYEGVAWSEGPALVYERLALAVVDDCPRPLDGALVLDVGAGTGVVGAVAHGRGARVIAADLSEAMLRAGQRRRPPAVLADVAALPFRPAFDAVLGGCVVNHFDEPARIIAAIAAAARPGGAVVLSAFPTRADPLKEAIDAVCRASGWEAPAWYRRMKAFERGLLGTADRFASAGRAGGLDQVHVVDHDVSMAGLTAEQAVAYRLGLAPVVPWLAALPPERARHVREEATSACAPLVERWAMPLLVMTGDVARARARSGGGPRSSRR